MLDWLATVHSLTSPLAYLRSSMKCNMSKNAVNPLTTDCSYMTFFFFFFFFYWRAIFVFDRFFFFWLTCNCSYLTVFFFFLLTSDCSFLTVFLTDVRLFVFIVRKGMIGRQSVKQKHCYISFYTQSLCHTSVLYLCCTIVWVFLSFFFVSHQDHWFWDLAGVCAIQRQTALQNHNLWSCRLCLAELDGESPRWKFEWEDSQKDCQKSRVTKAQPILHHLCQVSRIRGSRMVLNSTAWNRFTTARRLRSDSGWSWTFRIARMTLHDCEVVPLTSQTIACAIFFRRLFDRLPRSNFKLGPSQLDFADKICQIRDYLIVTIICGYYILRIFAIWKKSQN